MSNDPKLGEISKIINSRMERLIKEKGIASIANASTKLKGKAFLDFYIRDIAKILYQFDDDLIDEGLGCDYKGDLNADFVYKSDDTFFIYQSKYKGSGQSLTSGEIADFARIHARIMDRDFFYKHANDNLKDLLRDFTKKSVVHYVFLTNATSSTPADRNRMQDEFNMAAKEVTKNYPDCDIDFELKTLSEIKNDYKNAISIDEPIPDKVTIPVEKLADNFSEHKEYAYIDLTTILGNDTKYMTILTTIKGTELKNLYNQYQGRLFSYNIRGYLGLNAINKKMHASIKDNPSKFYLFNNGISAICSKLDLKPTNAGRGLQLEATKFQIINGAQTTCTIGRFQDDQKLKDVRVLLRITKTEDIKKEKGLNKQIITFNNSQTVIKASDFRSNDEIQLFLQNTLLQFQFKAPKPFQNLIYFPKRSSLKKKNGAAYVNLETLAKILYSFNYEPTKIYANSNFLFDADTSAGGKYWDLFGENGEECSFYTDERLKLTAAISMLWLYLDDKLKNQRKLSLKEKEETIEYQSYLAKWHFLWAYGCIIKNLYPNNLKWIVNKILDGKAFQSDNFIESWFPQIADKIYDQLVDEYDSDTKKQSDEETVIKGFNFKNWLRNPESFKKLKRKIERLRPEHCPLNYKDKDL